ncbi:MAG: PstS family phosphate ABC transporter substrate-binding protein [Actinomycetota bacterium]|nr:PstS family phosphate ABC transporter substrate-binding protein [Actinomycetota bacterium]
MDQPTTTRRVGFVALLLAALAVATAATAGLATAAKKKRPLSGTITADGSSTVGPWTTAAAERFRKLHPKVRITVGISGTGGGFERFCRGETDLSDASRPITQSEAATCRDNGVGWTVFNVANDGIAVVVNKANTWAKCLTTGELRKIWEAGSKVDSWRDVRPSFPNVSLKLYGPGTDSGTFDFFTEKINGKSRRSRSDYTASENDNILVRGVEGERGGLGYFGYSYYEENQRRLNVVRVNAGGGCVAPSAKTVQAKTYRPLSRPLFIYAKKDAFRRPEVRAFIGFALNNQAKVAKAARFVPLTKKEAKKSRNVYRRALR